MKALVIGAGMMGSALVYDLAYSDGIEKIVLADVNEERAKNVANRVGKAVEPRSLDVNCYDDVVELMREVEVAIGATTYTHNTSLTKAAIEAGVHFCDLGGNMDVVDRQLDMDSKAKEAHVCILPNCGLAPGLACVIAAGGAKKFERVDEIHIRVGGLPQHPKPPLNYQLVFSAEGLINEYIEPAEVIRNGEVKHIESMSDLEELEFPPPFGKLEAFNTSGGVSTLTRMFKGNIKELDYKTIRYKGHCEKFKTLLDLGFASAEPIAAGNSVRTARELFEELLRRKLPSNGPDVVLMRVTITGMQRNSQKTLAYEMIDYYDEKLMMTSMMRTTAFPTSIIAQMAVKGTITARGVVPPEQCVPLKPFMAELKKRNIGIKETII
ncbi:MAG: saccharopine dehydrogenase NADP-binding domain-containing protein [Ignavibacteriae bacterium]|nr:saccharopine dehydrogenase NADP-binding domain-containing protein [Ignavibacteriota bacterium]